MNDIKERIVDEAKKCFIHFGYNKTTMDNIGRAVGLKKNSLYHHFKNKEDIFKSVLEREADNIISDYRKRVSKVKGARDSIIAYLKLRLKSCNSQSALHLFLSELSEQTNPLTPLIEKMFYEKELLFIVSILEAGQEDGAFKEYDYQRLAGAIIKICNSIKQREMTAVPGQFTSEGSVQNDRDIIFIIETMLKGIEKSK